MNKTNTLLALAALTISCGGAIKGGTIGGSPPLEAPTYSFGIVACGVSVAVTDPCPSPIAGATIQINGTSGYVTKTADANGYVLAVSILPFSDIKISAPGFADFAVSIEPPKIAGQNLSFSLTRS